MDSDEVLTIEDTARDPRAAALLEHTRANRIGAIMVAPISGRRPFRGMSTFLHVGGTRG